MFAKIYTSHANDSFHLCQHMACRPQYPKSGHMIQITKKVRRLLHLAVEVVTFAGDFR